jgi:hypothetical protein
MGSVVVRSVTHDVLTNLDGGALDITSCMMPC